MTRAILPTLAALTALALATIDSPEPAEKEPASSAATPVVVGSKAFPESWILGEAAVQLLRESGEATPTHRMNLGGTEIVFQALRGGGIDVYPEYTGTISEVILKSRRRPEWSEMSDSLARLGIGMTRSLGFNDGYALAVRRDLHDRLQLRTLSDLARHPELKLGFTHEFIGREDGYPGLARAYGLTRTNLLGIQHELAYQALASGKIDVTDIYTTDAEIARLDLVPLVDDRGFFPRYDAVYLYRLEWARRSPRALAALRRLEGRIDEAKMIRANARVVLEKEQASEAADSLLVEALGTRAGALPRERGSAVAALGRNLGQHLRLVAISLFAAILLGLPLGILAHRSRWLARLSLAAAGIVQTIPSLALLAFLIPLLGIGVGPALVALFLYSLLPIVRNTYTGLRTIPPALLESAEVLGLTSRSRLLTVELPMASPAILAGIQTSAVINVGTATLAALIGAGGLGEPILSGIQLRDPSLILQGAVPAAALALLVQAGFDALERVLIPRGLRLAGD